jgi:hypothetical protein
MAEKTIKSRIQVKRGSSTDWKTAGSNGFIPKEGEIIFYSDLNKIKIGDGKTIVDSKTSGTTVLPFMHVDKSEIDSWAHDHDTQYYSIDTLDAKFEAIDKSISEARNYSAGEGISISEEGVISISFLHAEDKTF